MRFFFYGTLIDPDVRRIVLGARAASTAQMRIAELANWERRCVRGVSYPVILPRAGGRVRGVLASGLDSRSRRRLIVYEGAGYDLIRVEVDLGAAMRRAALAFVPKRGGPLKPASGDWSYEDWKRSAKRGFLREIGGGWAAARP